MNLYELTLKETWVLSTLLSLPIQHGSVLGEWLGLDDAPDVNLVQSWIPECLVSLEKKGYKQKAGTAAGELATTLLLASVGQKHIFASLRTSEKAVSTRFLLAGSGAVQYGYDPEKILLHSPIQMEQLEALLLPDWLKINQGDQSTVTMPLNAFLVFKQSCQQQSISYILNVDHNESFSLSDLENSFQLDNGWLDVYNALGMKGFIPLQDISILDQLETLVQMDWVEKISPQNFRVSSTGSALAEAFSDPHQVTVSISFSSVDLQKMTLSAFLIGSGHLFRVVFLDKLVTVSQMQSREQGLDWIKSQISAK